MSLSKTFRPLSGLFSTVTAQQRAGFSNDFKGAFYSPSKATFPVLRTEGAMPEVIYCHPLGCAWDMKLPLTLEKTVGRMGHSFTRFEYRNFANTEQLWDVRNWVEDIVTLLDRNQGNHSSIIFACSASAVAALAAAIERPEKLHSLILLSPGVGIEMDYMDRILPGSVEKLERGEAVVHPSIGDADEDGKPPRPGQLVNYENLMHYRDIDPVHHFKEIPIQCPVRIMHGIRDFLVPYQNSLLLADKLQSEEVEVMLLEDAYHVIDWIPEIAALLERGLRPPTSASFAAAPTKARFHNKTALTDYLSDLRLREEEKKRIKAEKAARAKVDKSLQTIIA